jgi:Tfp pilus assembly protein PilV
MNSKNTRSRHAQRGFSIIEALIAGLVLSFGSLALIGVQVALTRNGDVAKQRSEATRLAQEKMEQLRAYASELTLTGVSSYAAMGAGNDAITAHDYGNSTTTQYNTAFNRAWTISGAGTDVHREVSVVVTWFDRRPDLDSNGQPILQSVRLSSVVARTNYSKVGLIMANAGGPGMISVRQRHTNVPYPAIDIGNDKSTYQWPGTTAWYVFDNNTADVNYICTTQPTNGANPASNPNCTQILAYVLAGYVSSAPSNGATDNIDTVLSGWQITDCALTGASNVVVPTPPVPCLVQNVVTATSTINPNCPYLVSNITPTSSQLQGLKFYKCYAKLIQVPLNSTAGWTGRLGFLTAPANNQRICRFNHNVVDVTTGIYGGVHESLNNENYYALLAANGNGPGSRCPTPGTTQHQP